MITMGNYSFANYEIPALKRPALGSAAFRAKRGKKGQRAISPGHRPGGNVQQRNLALKGQKLSAQGIALGEMCNKETSP